MYKSWQIKNRLIQIEMDGSIQDESLIQNLSKKFHNSLYNCIFVFFHSTKQIKEVYKRLNNCIFISIKNKHFQGESPHSVKNFPLEELSEVIKIFKPEFISIKNNEFNFIEKLSNEYSLKKIDTEEIIENFELQALPNLFPTKNDLSKIEYKNHYATDLVLRTEPIWFDVIEFSSKTISVYIQLKYLNTKATNKKAVLLVSTLEDVNENFLDISLPFSNKLGSRFLYIPNLNQLTQVIQFKVTSRVSKIRIGLASFNTNPEEIIHLEKIHIRIDEDNYDQNTDYKNPLVSTLSSLGWNEKISEDKVTALAIVDEFTDTCLSKSLNLIKPRPDNWYGLLESYNPQFIFIESAWKGNYGSWEYRIGEYKNAPGFEIKEMSQYAKEKCIPLVFWNKEDPVHFEKFIRNAKFADYIYTTDSNMIEKYQKMSDAKINFMQFSAEPSLHQPSALYNRNSLCCFAGSWYGERYKDRDTGMNWILDAGLSVGLHIYDRNFAKQSFKFPNKFSKSVRGGLPYEILCGEYGKYRFFLNVNSITNSPTMFSRRVFELLGCGTPVISTYALGIEKTFNSKSVWLVNDREEAVYATKILMSDDKEWRRRSLLGIREIFCGHTYEHRIKNLLLDLKISNNLNLDPKVCYVVKNFHFGQKSQLLEFINNQNYTNYVVYINSSSNNIDIPDQKYVKYINLTMDVVINESIDFIGFINFNNFYGPNYTIDLVNATRYSKYANGWSKSIDIDFFDYCSAGHLEASIWRPNYFFKNLFGSNKNFETKDNSMYVIDSSNFSFTKEELEKI